MTLCRTVDQTIRLRHRLVTWTPLLMLNEKVYIPAAHKKKKKNHTERGTSDTYLSLFSLFSLLQSQLPRPMLQPPGPPLHRRLWHHLPASLQLLS